MAGCSTKRKRGDRSPTTTATEFAADPNHPTAARIGCDSPTDGDADGASSKICSIRDGTEPNRRQSSLLSFFAKAKRTKTKQSKPRLDRRKGDSIRAGTSDDPSGESFPSSSSSSPPPPPLSRKTHLFFGPPHKPGTKTVPREQMPSSESASSSKPKTKTKSLTQVYIDCGQSRFGQILCKKCGMLYVPGIPEDELQHKQLCQAYTLGIPCFRGTVKSGKRLPDDAAAKPRDKEGRINAGASVVMWKPGFPSRNRSRSKQACQPITTTKEPNRCTYEYDNLSDNLPSQWPLLARIVSKDLGTNEDTTLNHLSSHTVFLCIGSSSSSGSGTSTTSTTTRAGGARRSASAGRSRILGVATVQVLGRGVPAYEMISPHERSLEPIARIPALGIGLLWTHPSERHRGIATRLVDAARGHAVFGLEVERTRVAFSSPTRAGYGFALRYGLLGGGGDDSDDPGATVHSERQSEVAPCRTRRGPLVYEMDL